MSEFKRGTNYNRRMAGPVSASSTIATAGTGRLIRQTFTRADCQDCGKPLASDGHGECVEPEESVMSVCAHDSLEVALNAAGEPVRLLCPCGREWRVLPIEMKVRRVP